ncbi:MAG: mercuric reductase [Acidobacteriota bacterium]
MAEPLSQPDSSEEERPEIHMLPWDGHNQKLIGNVHPADWVNPTPQERYHLVVIGAGTAGLVTAIVAAGLGAKVALIEKHLMGGDCLNVGCVPSKGVISAARAWDPRHREQFGAPEPSGDGDFGKAMERMRQLRANISDIDGAQRFTDAGVDVFLGAGRFAEPGVVEVGGQQLRYRKAVIATGARAAAPPIPGLDGVEYRTNETIFSLTEKPKSLVVIGAGPIGCEMAQSFARFGTEVTLIDMADHVLSREDAEAAAVVEESMLKDGVRLEMGAKILEVSEREENGSTVRVVTFERDGETHAAVGEELLVAVGRKPNVESLNLEAVGVDFDRGGVKVDDRLRTSNKNVYAAGDVTHHLKFTHLADAHAAIVIQNALFFGRAKTSRLVVPWCTYTTPEIAHVGLYEHQAKEQGIAVDVIKIALDDVDRAILDGEDEGFLKVVLKKGSDEILGGTLVAHHAGDMIGPLSLAITHGIGLGKFARTIFPYPTQGEVLKKAANAWNKTRLSPTAKSVLSTWFKIFK